MSKILSVFFICFLMLSTAYAADMIQDVSGARGSQEDIQQLPAGALQLGALLLFEDGTSEFGGNNIYTPRDVISRAIEINDALLRTMANWPVLLPRSFLPRQRDSLNNIAQLAKQGDHLAVAQRWGQLMAGFATGGIPSNVNTFMQYVLRETYLNNTKDLQFLAGKIQYYNKIKKDLGDHLIHNQKLAARMNPYDARNFAAVLTIVRFPPPFKPGATLQGSTMAGFELVERRMNRGDLLAYIKLLEEKHYALSSNTARDEQDYLSRRKQLIERIANTSKVLHDKTLDMMNRAYLMNEK